MLFSCKNDVAVEENVAADSTEIHGSVPDTLLTIDSAYICNAPETDSLSYHDIRRNQGRISEVSKVSLLQAMLGDFCMIDSLKRIGKYAEYVDSLDLGMTQNATAHSLGTITMKNGTPVDLWRLQFSSYEACPVSSGTCVVGSVRHGSNVSHMVLGKLFYWADPPSGFEENLTSVIHDDRISITTTSINEDFDAETQEKNTECYTVRISSDGSPEPESAVKPEKVP